MTDTDRNPVERRLDYLSGLWESFTLKPSARLLRWVIDGEIRRLIDTFLEVHKHDPADISDLFLVFEVPSWTKHRN